MSLFRLKGLKTLSDIEQIIALTVHKCNNIANACINDINPNVNSIKYLDEISNTLCNTLDPLSTASRVNIIIYDIISYLYVFVFVIDYIVLGTL